MAFGTAEHGNNAIVYINGSELVGGNSWEITVDHESAEYRYFGNTWVRRLVGVNDWSGSLGAVEDHDAKILITAATTATVLALLIYPLRTDLTTGYSGNAIFSMGASADSTSASMQTCSFVGDNTMTPLGWS